MHPLPRHAFASRMREVRSQLGISQIAVARYLTERLDYTVDSSAISRIEAGDRRIVRLDEAVLIAEVLQVPLSELLNPQGTSLLAQIDDVHHRLRGAQDALDASLAEVENRREVVEQLTVELEALESQEQAEEKAAVERDLVEEFRISSGPR